jgi:hypothetical protein
LSRGTLSLYETGKRSIGRPLLNRLAVTLGYSKEDVDRALTALARIPGQETPLALTPASLLPHEHRAAEAAAERAAVRVRLGVGTRLIEARLRSERLEAASLWDQFRKLSTFRACRDRIDADPRFRSWALCERLCDESSHAAARDVGTSRALARLALKVAEKTSGSEPWQCRVQGYAWAFVANSLRVGGDFSAAEKAFLHSREFWKEAEPTASAPFDGGRILRMTAILRKIQGRFGEAQVLLLASEQSADLPEKLAPLRLDLASLFAHQGKFEESLATLISAESIVAEAGHPRLRLILEFSRTTNLCHLGQFGDAARVLGSVQRSALDLGNELDTLRVSWLSARVTAGFGRKSEAIARLAKVRQAFLRRNLAHDANLATLEISELRRKD